jgi:TolA-binding protein
MSAFMPKGVKHMKKKVFSLPILALLIAIGAGTSGCSTHQSEAALLQGLQPVERFSGQSRTVFQEDAYQVAADHFRAGRYGLAGKIYQDLLARQPDSIRALNGAGAVFDQLGRYELA